MKDKLWFSCSQCVLIYNTISHLWTTSGYRNVEKEQTKTHLETLKEHFDDAVFMQVSILASEMLKMGCAPSDVLDYKQQV